MLTRISRLIFINKQTRLYGPLKPVRKTLLNTRNFPQVNTDVTLFLAVSQSMYKKINKQTNKSKWRIKQEADRTGLDTVGTL